MNEKSNKTTWIKYIFIVEYQFYVGFSNVIVGYQYVRESTILVLQVKFKDGRCEINGLVDIQKKCIFDS